MFVTIQSDDDVRADTVGRAAPQVELKIDDNGEVLYRSPGVFHSYYRNEEATRETKTEDGWVHTGDAGLLDQDGHLRIIDRAKDVGKLNDGAMFAPKYLENKLKFFPQIAEAVTFGHERDYAAAFVNIDLDAVSNWAERNGISYASYQELAAHPRVYEMVGDCIGRTNADLARDPQLASSQIRRFSCSTRSSTPTTESSPVRARCAGASSPSATLRSSTHCIPTPIRVISTPRWCSRTGVAGRSAPI